MGPLNFDQDNPPESFNCCSKHYGDRVIENPWLARGLLQRETCRGVEQNTSRAQSLPRTIYVEGFTRAMLTAHVSGSPRQSPAIGRLCNRQETFSAATHLLATAYRTSQRCMKIRLMSTFESEHQTSSPISTASSPPTRKSLHRLQQCRWQ